MTIDELQERFNELRKKKWRTIAGKYPVTFTGFDAGGYGPQIFIEIAQPTCSSILGIDPFMLSERFRATVLIEEVSPYTDWPIDAKILVADSDKGPKRKRYFAGVSTNGKPMGWISGGTSWSEFHTYEWDYAELAED